MDEPEYWRWSKALYGLKHMGTGILASRSVPERLGAREMKEYLSTNTKAIIGTQVDDLVGITRNKPEEGKVEKQVELDKKGKSSTLLGLATQKCK